MSSRIQFYPIFGSNAFEPRCFILKIDEFRLLLDCGWDSRFDLSVIEALKSVDLTSIDAVLLSQPDLLHIGALPYAYAKLGLSAPIFATAPIWRMGQYMLMDAFVSIHQTHANFDLFTHEDIKKVFKTKFKSKLKYSQEHPLIKEIKRDGDATTPTSTTMDDESKKQDAESQQNKLVKRIGNSNTMTVLNNNNNNNNNNNGSNNNNDIITLIITPYSAGHMVGGTIWKISYETDNIIYAVDYNIRREKHLNESVFGILEIRPTLLITDCINIGQVFTVRRKQRENQLYNLCITTLKNGGNVLIPSDSSGRCLEILYSLYSSFNKHKDFMRYHLVFLSYTSKNTLNSAKSMLEWMCDSCQKELNKSQKNVFDFKELLICQTISEFRACIKFPYVCIATNELLESGLSQEIFLTLSKHTSNLVLLTQRCAAQTLTGKILNIIHNKSNTENRNIEFKYYFKQRLSNEEKIKYLQQKKDKQLLLEKKEKQERENAIAFDDGDGDGNGNGTGDGDDIDMQVKDDDNDVDMDVVIYDRELNKQIKMMNEYDMYPYGDDVNHAHACDEYMTDYGIRIDLNEWRVEADGDGSVNGLDAADRKRRMSMDDDEYEIEKRKSSLSPSPNDIVAQTMSLLPSEVLFPDPSHPYKTCMEMKRLFIKCQLKYLNIEGRSDYESIKQTLPTLQPRQIILVHGSNQQKKEFKQFIIEEKICKNNTDVIEACNNKWFAVKTNTKYKKIIMDDIIERYLSFYNINGYDVAYLNGKLKENKSLTVDVGDLSKYKSSIKDIKYKLCHNNKKSSDEYMDDNTNEDDINKININYPWNDGHSLTYLGDVTKIEMETNLKEQNIPAELYYGGTLVAGKSGEVRVTHKNPQKTILSVNATLTKDYFGIRDTLENQYHLI